MGLASSISSSLEKKTFTPSRRVGAGVGLDLLASVKWTSSGHNRTIFCSNVLHAMLFSRLVAECSLLCIGISGTENRVSCGTQIVEFRQKAVPLCLKYSATKGKRPGQLSAFFTRSPSTHRPLTIKRLDKVSKRKYRYICRYLVRFWYGRWPPARQWRGAVPD
jgi:hypothetical protein